MKDISTKTICTQNRCVMKFVHQFFGKSVLSVKVSMNAPSHATTCDWFLSNKLVKVNEGRFHQMFVVCGKTNDKKREEQNNVILNCWNGRSCDVRWKWFWSRRGEELTWMMEKNFFAKTGMDTGINRMKISLKRSIQSNFESSQYDEKESLGWVWAHANKQNDQERKSRTRGHT